MMESEKITRLYFNAILRKWWLLVVCVAAAVVPGVLYILLVDPTFESQIRVLIQDRGLLVQKENFQRKDQEFLTTQAEIIRSPLVVKRSVEKVAAVASDKPDADPVKKIIKELRVTTLADTDIVRISFRNSDPQHSVDRLKAIVESYREQIQEIEKGTSGNTLELLEKREKSLLAQRNKIESELEKILNESPLIGGTREGVRVETDSLKDLSKQIFELRLKRIRLENLFQLQPESDSANDQFLGVLEEVDDQASKSLRDLQANLWNAEVLVRELSSVYGPEHSDRKKAENKLTVLKDLYSKSLLQANQNLKKQLESSKSDEKRYQTLYDTERDRLNKLNTYLFQEEQLQVELKQIERKQESTFAFLHQNQLKDEALAGGQSAIIVRVLDDFRLPENPIWPKPLTLITACVMIGGLLGLVLIVLLERLPLPGMSISEPQTITQKDVQHQHSVITSQNGDEVSSTQNPPPVQPDGGMLST
jgi:polysaccharide biosynthesis transport protein